MTRLIRMRGCVRRTLAVAALAWACAASAGRAQTASPFGVHAALTRGAEGAPSTLAVSLTVPAGHYLYADRLSIGADGVLTPLQAPAPERKLDPILEEEVSVYAHDTVFTYAVPSGATVSAVTVALQGCSPSVCFVPERRSVAVGDALPSTAPSAPPRAGVVSGDGAAAGVEGFVLSGREVGYLTVDAFTSFLDRVEAGAGLAGNPLTRMIDRYGIALALLVILIGGAALNLTPCVLPMIPVNLAIIGAGSASGARGRGFLLGGCYGAGIALAYGTLGVVVVLTGGQFGRLNASPWFNLAIAAVFLALALSMVGVFTIDLSRFQGRTAAPGGGGGRGAAATAFVFGGLAALLAGACVAPVLIWVLLLATEIYQRGNVAGLALPFVLGLGMALPWPFAGAGMAFLPKPGAWMDRVKIGFGIVIGAAALYYGALGVRLLSAGTAAVEAGRGEGAGIPWETELDRGLALARESGRPVFVDIWATWCTACKKMNRTTLTSPVVRDRLADYVPVKLQAEDLGAPELAPLLKAWGVRGLPSYIVLRPERRP